MQYETGKESVKKDLKQSNYKHQTFPHIPQLHNNPAQPLPNPLDSLIDHVQQMPHLKDRFVAIKIGFMLVRQRKDQS
jgi:hypothetical protein